MTLVHEPDASYDVVVIGSGSAGSVVAARLTEDSSVRVLLVESGGLDQAPSLDVPIASPSFLKSAFDWNYESEPEDGLDGRRMTLAHGRVLGGSSTINSMIYLRGSHADYDRWSSAGATGWDYDAVLPYFRRSERNDRGADDFHGDSGPQAVSNCRNRSALSEAFIDAATEAGHAYNPDLNGETFEGVGYPQVTQLKGRRWSTASGYLHPVLDRPNLHVVLDTHVTGLSFDGDRVTGVDLLSARGVAKVRADSEVVLSAGSYATPQLLMLAGIGPADDLRRLGITVRQDLPVGQDLQDHLRVGMVFRATLPSLPSQLTPEAFEQFERDGTGPVSSNVGETAGFVRTTTDVGEANFQVSGVPAMVGAMIGLESDGVSLCGWTCRPTSRGELRLRDSSPLSRPVITHRYLSTDEDRRVTADGVRALLEIGDQPSFAEVVTGEPVSAPASRSDDDILEHVRRTGMTAHHPCGTAGIGRVVDESLKVYGVDGLRVVDASVMPTIPSSNINAATIMIGEKGADLLSRTA